MSITKLTKQEKFDKILDVGRSLFAKDGLGMSMRELATKAGFGGVSSLYRYVGNKRELWFAIVNKDVIEYNIEFEKIMLDPSLVSNQAILLKMLSQFLEYSRNDFDKFRIVFLMEPPESEILDGEFELVHNPKIFQNFLVVVQRGIQTNEFSGEDPILMIGVIWSMIMGAAISLSPLYDFMKDKIIPPEIRKQLGDPQIALHEETIKKITELYFN